MQISSMPRYESSNVGGGLTRRPLVRCSAPKCYKAAAWELYRSLDGTAEPYCTTHVENIRKDY